MPRRFAMSTMVTRCQQRCDLENENHIAPAEWKSLVSEQYGELYSIVAESGLRYFETIDTISTTGAASYAEPADHLGTVLVARVLDSAGRRVDLNEIMAQERSRWTGMTGAAAAYALVDDQIYLYPTPPAGQTYEVLYIPQPPDLSAFLDADIIDVVNPDGEAFLIWGVAVKALAKSNSDVSLAQQEREAARVRLIEWSTLRAFNQPRRRIVEPDAYTANDHDAADWRFR